jgi:hypothetical protein
MFISSPNSYFYIPIKKCNKLLDTIGKFKKILIVIRMLIIVLFIKIMIRIVY